MTTSGFSTPIDDRYFEDYVVGSIHLFGPLSVERAEVIAYAERYDPQAMHMDPEAAEKGPFKGLIASGWHTVGLLMRLYVEHYLSHVASLASPGVDKVRWIIPVRPGDALSLRVTVCDARPSRTKPDRGIVFSLLEGLDQAGRVVCSLEAMNLLARRPVQAAGGPQSG